MDKKGAISFSKENFIIKTEGKVNDKYLKIQELGYGGFSKVYRVENKATHKVKACKELLRKKITDIIKFKSEINIMSKCDHPNIVKLIEIFEDSRYIDLIMEECEGGSLFDRLIKKMEEEDEIFTEREAAVIFKQIISAINYCHNQGICHRDLKMDNILFVNSSKDSPIKIIDFGLSLVFGDPFLKTKKERMTSSVGTPHYISPEVLKGDYNEKCDIWSAGVILYILLSGAFPFDGNSNKEIYKAVLSKKYKFPQDEWAGVSEEAKDLVKHMLCDQDKRYSAEMVLNHPWIKKLAPNSNESLGKLNVNHLKQYKNYCGFKKFAITYIASRLGEKDIKNLKKLFYELDDNKDGTLTLEEVRQCLLKLDNDKGAKLDDKELNLIFKGIDTNNSQRIEYTEFIAAALEQSVYLKEDKLIEIFKFLDKDGSGKISKNEIKKALNNEKIDEESIMSFIQKFDLNGDGEIDYDEFITNMS